MTDELTDAVRRLKELQAEDLQQSYNSAGYNTATYG